jgi:hypothetical protein
MYLKAGPLQKNYYTVNSGWPLQAPLHVPGRVAGGGGGGGAVPLLLMRVSSLS